MQHFFQHGEKGEDLVREVALAARQRGKAGCQVLKYREARKDLAALRHYRQARTRTFMRRKSVEEAVLPTDAPGTDRLKSADRPQQAGLADSVAAEDAGHFALPRR